MSNDPQTLSSQPGTDSHSTGAQEGGGIKPTSSYRCRSSSFTAQDGIKHGLDSYMTIRGDAESRDLGASIPAAHQLRALSAGHCHSLCFSPLASPCLRPAACIPQCFKALCHATLWTAVEGVHMACMCLSHHKLTCSSSRQILLTHVPDHLLKC